MDTNGYRREAGVRKWKYIFIHHNRQWLRAMESDGVNVTEDQKFVILIEINTEKNLKWKKECKR